MANTKRNIGLFGEVEYYQIGPFPFVKEGCLLIDELRWFDKQNTRKLTGVKAVLEIAAKIADTEKIGEAKALAIINDLESQENQIYALKYVDEIYKIQDSQYTELDYKQDVCMMLLNSRVDKTFFIEHKDALHSKYGMEIDSSATVTSLGNRFPESIMDDIFSFMVNEKNKWVDYDSSEESAPTLGE